MNDQLAHERPICGAKTRKGTPCKRSPMANGRCNLHGGKSLRGVESPVFKDGRYSKSLPVQLHNRWQETQDDPDLLSLEDEIRLVDVMLKGNLENLDTEESGKAWALIRRAVDTMELAIDREDFGGIKAALLGMRDVIDVRVAHYATEQEIREKIDQRRKLVESIQKSRLAGENAVSLDKLMVFIAQLHGLLVASITDNKELNKVLNGVDNLLSIPGRTSESVGSDSTAANGRVNGHK